ncbi:MAG: AhpC/TSA family protein [Bacteroidetes bacterium]|nr:AhpC/TSA family protein [Bacteroidota bacterium]MBS1931830.1 AhpC/TSA family protein [Bacteroidota bacterium]
MKRVFITLCTFFFFCTVYSQKTPEGLFINSKAPDFKAKDQSGLEVHLKDLLKKGEVVLVFYRGQWCPYCYRELKRLADSVQQIIAKGATLVAVTPEKPASINTTIEKTSATYSILYDKGLKIMKAYDVAFEVDGNTLTRYRNTGIDIEANNGENGKYLPVPAVFIIDKQSTIRYRYFEPNYKKRPSVKEILDNL